MAGDWIKMRTDLFTHPKIVRMASALDADTYRIIGGLLSVWSLFDVHSTDGVLEGYAPEVLDRHLRWDGFAASMIDIGWLEDHGGKLVMPRFETHNGSSAKRRAQDADRKRAVRNVSASEADKKRTREEKRREEKKEQKQKQKTAPDGELFDGVDPEVAADFKAMRAKMRAPVTKTAMAGIRREAAAAGITVQEALAMCCERGWRGFKADWLKDRPSSGASGSTGYVALPGEV